MWNFAEHWLARLREILNPPRLVPARTSSGVRAARWIARRPLRRRTFELRGRPW